MKTVSFAGLAACLLLSVPASAYEVIEVKGGGAIAGSVLFKGPPPKPKKLPVNKDQNICGKGEVSVEEVSVAGNGGVSRAVAYLDELPAGKEWENPPEQRLLDQKGCRFVPTILIYPKETDVTITNSDPVAHNIHMYEVTGRVRSTLFNTAQPKPGTLVKPVRPRKSNTVKVECDVHNFMHGWLFAAPNPYYALTENGRFSLTDVPPGKYKLKVWHPVLGTKAADVSVSAGKTSSVSLEWSGKP